MTPGKYIESINELLLKKKALLLEILAFTQSQCETITEAGMDNLNHLIDGKQLKIDEINKLDDEFGAYCQKLKSALGIAHLDQLDTEVLEAGAAKGAKLLKAQTAEILDVVRSISEIEKENARKSKKLLEQFGNEIKRINQGKKANNAYKTGYSNAPSYFLDKKK